MNCWLTMDPRYIQAIEVYVCDLMGRTSWLPIGDVWPGVWGA